MNEEGLAFIMRRATESMGTEMAGVGAGLGGSQGPRALQRIACGPPRHSLRPQSFSFAATRSFSMRTTTWSSFSDPPPTSTASQRTPGNPSLLPCRQMQHRRQILSDHGRSSFSCFAKIYSCSRYIHSALSGSLTPSQHLFRGGESVGASIAALRRGTYPGHLSFSRSNCAGATSHPRHHTASQRKIFDELQPSAAWPPLRTKNAGVLLHNTARTHSRI